MKTPPLLTNEANASQCEERQQKSKPCQNRKTLGLGEKVGATSRRSAQRPPLQKSSGDGVAPPFLCSETKDHPSAFTAHRYRFLGIAPTSRCRSRHRRCGKQGRSVCVSVTCVAVLLWSRRRRVFQSLLGSHGSKTVANSGKALRFQDLSNRTS